MTVTNPNNDSQPESFREHAENQKEDLTVGEGNGSASQTCTDPVQVFLPVSEEDGAALEEQLSSKENSQCNLEKKQKASQEESSNVHMADVKEMTKEAAAAGGPAKKKRRMGMCGLTERERSHFLQTQKRENGHNGAERVVRQICTNTEDHEAQEEVQPSPSIPVSSVTEQDEAAVEHQSSSCGEDDRAEPEVHMAVTDSDGSSSKGESGEGGGELTGEPKSEPPAEEEEEEEEEEELFGNQQQQELEGHREAQEPVKDTEVESAVVEQCPVLTSYSNQTENEQTENRAAAEAALLLVTGTSDKKEEELTGGAGSSDGAEGASSSDSRSGGFSPEERKHRCDADGVPGADPSALNAQTRDSSDPFGSGNLDYVSDSQLNTIFLTEEEEMEREEDDSPDGPEDATDLICGLIRELSSLNRKVMAAHRELENLRRSSKSSRSATR
ncbi:FK506-binding protein 5-like [Centropristis striata]|uniref:FK506-binding protein 5-like n=1 Tax=Centropristis striata TaxID=184440 RepID=UPI0027E16709|nr:FK506-binding protein 5-like [Centropristis striata]